VTTNEKVALREIIPLVAVTVTVVVPAARDCVVASWKDIVADVCPSTETDSGPEGTVVAPAGSPDKLKLTAPVKPLAGFTCMLWNCGAPAC
jgi:hypothetical protein